MPEHITLTMQKWFPNEVARTRPLMPSKLALAFDCSLRYLLETENSRDALLPESVASCVGRAVHSVIDRVIKHSLLPEPEMISAAAKRELERLMAAHDTVAAISAIRHRPIHADLLVPNAEFIEKLRIVFRLFEGSTSQDHSYVAIRRQPLTKYSSRGRAEERLSELHLKSSVLDLAGRADIVERLHADAIRVTEIKTGRAFVEGRPKRSVLLQASAYGLIEAERNPTATVILRIIASDGEYEEELTSSLATETQIALRGLSDRIPHGVHQNMTALASPGDACRDCRYRPKCIGYRGWAEQRWRRTRDLLPLDVWGHVEHVDQTATDLLDLRLRDAAERPVRVSSVPRQMLLGVGAGSIVEAFGLASAEHGRSHAFPQNFYVIDRWRPYRSAYSAFIRVQQGVH